MDAEIVHESNEKSGNGFGARGDKKCHVEEELCRCKSLSCVFVALYMIDNVLVRRGFVSKTLENIS
jgi:hypothetical protein